MELKSKPGWQELQEALDSPYVDKIVKFLIRETNQMVFSATLQFLRANSLRVPSTPPQKLQALRSSLQGSINHHGDFTTPSDLDELIQIIANMYEEDQINLNHLRGAIVELFATELVGSRCISGECGNNYAFVDEEYDYESPQIDVAVLSNSTLQIEGYSCKVILKRLTPDDRDNLIKLANHGQKRGFRTHMGAVSFDRSEIALQQLRNLRCETSIKAYGADNIKELRNNPFK